ncbi:MULTISPECIES: cytochrome c biogenesis CcdA family protein [unclassified Haladaptatus]|uniref:cytochrome c biogenesis CcdA family protein n=1 Tax=unclassified Haladaptatus TaxID=2622732 RepID=UPI0023E852A4|nr:MULTISPECIES: cytochrome c biogenesis protein CcdA [unclassified Haladaptatus]
MVLEDLRLGFAFTAGVLTFFAPCSYPLLPGYVAYYLGSGDDAPQSTGRRLQQAVLVGSLVSAGFFLVYAALVGLVVAVGTQAFTNISLLELVVGSLLVFLGGAMALGKTPTRLHLTIQLPARTRSSTGFVLFGVVYAGAAAGCTAPLFIAVSLSALAAGPSTAVVTLAAYAAGMSVLMILVTALSALGRETLLRRLSRNVRGVTRAAGVLLVLAGLLQIYLFLFEFDGLRILGLG